VSAAEVELPAQECIAVQAPQRGKAFAPGFDPRRNPGGRPRKLRDLQRMLNQEHRTIENMREVLTRLRALALGEIITVPYLDPDGMTYQLKAELQADARFMQLYLDVVMGPKRGFDDSDSMDLSDAPTEVIEYLRIKVSR